MCLAIPGKILERTDEDALVDFQGNRLRINTTLTPEAVLGNWVLVHAGFSISIIEEQDALETWDYLRQCGVEGITQAAGEEGGTT
jgi:hydrogenase expression/formation protein HypC